MISHSSDNGRQIVYPRPLTSFEKETLLWLLPEDRPGYKMYRRYVESWSVVGEGRRGLGNYILADPGTVPDKESPLPQVFAYGMIESDSTSISATLRELLEDQLEFEIINVHGDEIPPSFVEKRRWNFSRWVPSQACPMCLGSLREVMIRRESGPSATLAICAADKRLWIFDDKEGVNHLIPVTNFHNAIMLHKGIRDPEKALEAVNFFKDLRTFSDYDLTAAFVQYNKLRRKIDLGGVITAQTYHRTLVDKLISYFRT